MSALKSFQQGFGLGASEVISDTSAHTGKNYQVIVVATSTVISSITSPNISGVSNYVGATLSPGYAIYGTVTAITLTSGMVHAYNSCDP